MNSRQGFKSNRTAGYLSGLLAVMIFVGQAWAISAPRNLRLFSGNGYDLPAGAALQSIDGGSNYFGAHGLTYAHNAGWDDPSFFPIGVWYGMFVSQADVNRWKDLGLNTSFRTTANSNISLLRNNGLWAIVGEEGSGPEVTGTLGSETVGLMAYDEPDNMNAWTQGLATTPNSEQDGRYWWINCTWNFIYYGGISPVDSSVDVLNWTVATPNSTLRKLDAIGVDIYWFTWGYNGGMCLEIGGLMYNLGRDMTLNECKRGSLYGDMVDRLREFQTPPGSMPIFQVIENGGPMTEDTQASYYITPSEMNWAVWSSIIHGARQICYFNHSFAGPAQSNDNFDQTYYQTVQPGQTISIYNQAKATNALIKQLAPMINAPTVLGYVTVTPSPAAFSGIETMAKYYNRQLYIFADTRESETATNIHAIFTIKNTGSTSVTVINEGRTLPITNGGTTFTDTFATGATVHIYRIN